MGAEKRKPEDHPRALGTGFLFPDSELPFSILGIYQPVPSRWGHPRARMILAPSDSERGSDTVLDQLRMILAAEAAARQQFEAAREEGAGLVRQAEADARQQVRAAREAREALARAVEDRIVADAQQQASRIREEENALAAAMRAAAEPRMAEAANAIVLSVLGQQGDHDE